MIKTSIRQLLELQPWLYLSILKLKRYKHWSKEWVLSKDSDCVIEGYPRSASSFAFSAFKDVQVKVDFKVATHTHSPAQIARAVHLNIPTMLCIRHPVDVISAHVAFRVEVKYKESISHLSHDDFFLNMSENIYSEVREMASRWLFFHEQIYPLKDQLFVATFEDITSSFEQVSTQFVKWSGKDWEYWSETKLPTKKLLSKGYHIGPTQWREEIKKEVRNKVENLVDEPLFCKCKSLYREFIK